MTNLSLRAFPFVASVLLAATAHAQDKVPQLGKDPIPAVIKAMTLEEKVKLLVGKGLFLPGIIKAPTDDTPDKITGIDGHTTPIPRVGIPSLNLTDGPAGINRNLLKQDSANNLFSTAWPIGTMLASTWNPALVQQMGTAYGNELKDYGMDFVLGPGMNIHRNPLGGRNFEYFSEDPLVTGKIGAALINGLQSTGVGATPKHFVANNTETNRGLLNTIVSERALREIYLRGFEIAVKEAHPTAMMSSYNLVNGTYTSESHDLLTTILRDEWGYTGLVMSDWFGGKNPVAQQQAGNNLIMPGTKPQIAALVEAVKSGKLSEKVLDDNIAGYLKVMVQTPTFKNYQFSNHPDLAKNAQVSRQAAAEGMILLKNNDQTLPITSTSKTIAIFGNQAFDLITGGTGSGDVTKRYKVSLVEGLTKSGFKLNEQVQQTYVNYLKAYKAKHPKRKVIQEFTSPTPLAPEYKWDKAFIDQSANTSDLAIIYVGRVAGENNDRKVADDFALTALEKEMYKNITDAFHAQHKKVIAVLNTGGVIDVASFRDQMDAILLAWQPGQEGGNAMADILSGKLNPSGKLATSMPVAYTDVSSAKNFPGKATAKGTEGVFGAEIPSEVTYEEGIYVGYRYYGTFGIKPAYEFGYGLSYTSFGYSPVKLSAATFADKLTATVTITNTGKVAGKEVVELYLAAPAKKLDKPTSELKSFAKTGLLQPGQSQTLTLTLTPKDLASFDTKTSAWVAEAGKYTVQVGASSLNIKTSASFSLPAERVVEKDHKALAPKVTINELKPKPGSQAKQTAAK